MGSLVWVLADGSSSLLLLLCGDKESQVQRTARLDTLNEKASPTSSNESGEPDQLDMEVAQEKREKKAAKQGSKHMEEPEVEAYEEGGDDLVVEDEEGEVLGVHHVRGESDAEKRQHILDDEEALRRETSGEHAKGKFHPHEKDEGEEMERRVSETLSTQSKRHGGCGRSSVRGMAGGQRTKMLLDHRSHTSTSEVLLMLTSSATRLLSKMKTEKL